MHMKGFTRLTSVSAKKNQGYDIALHLVYYSFAKFINAYVLQMLFKQVTKRVMRDRNSQPYGEPLAKKRRNCKEETPQ